MGPQITNPQIASKSVSLRICDMLNIFADRPPLTVIEFTIWKHIL